MNIAFKKKINRRMRIFEHRIFSKSFGGKIRHSWTDITYRINKEKKNGAYVLRAPDFFWRENLTRWKGLNKVDYNVSQNCEINTLGLEPFQFLVGTRCDLERNVLYLLCALVISLSCLGCSPVHLRENENAQWINKLVEYS